MRPAIYVLASLNIIAWGGLAWIGANLIGGVINRHAPGYPTLGQQIYAIATPLAFLTVSLGALIWSLRTGRGAQLAVGVLVSTLFCLLIYLYGFGTGI